MTLTAGNAAIPSIALRILNEGYGPGAWHGPDLKAALADVAPDRAFRRPGEGRHNIAEIAMHHAYYVRSVRSRISGSPAEPFALDGDDWFTLSNAQPLTWTQVRQIVEDEQQRLAGLVEAVEAGHTTSPLHDAERLELVLGITCHAVYHAGQVQLINRLIGS